jgi:hypothetical protein
MAYLDAGACSVPRRADDTCARNVPCVGDGSPALRKTGMCRGEARASQVTGPSSSYVPWSNTPPETPPSSPRRHVCKGVLLPSGKTGPSASGKTIGFGAACPMAHMFARLRIADHISGIVARLTTGSGGLTLGRAGFAPAGRQTKFHEVIASSFPFDPHCLVALIFLSPLSPLSIEDLPYRMRGKRKQTCPVRGAGRVSAGRALLADPVKFEAESATSETHKWVAPDGP